MTKTATSILYHLLRIVILLFQPNLNLALSTSAAAATSATAASATAAAAATSAPTHPLPPYIIPGTVRPTHRPENLFCKLGNHLEELASKQQSDGVAFYEDVALINHCSSRQASIPSFAHQILC